MNITDAPKKQPVPFGVNGQRENLLATTPAGDNTASYDAGFPAVTMILKAAGGLPPKGQDMNQILYELSSIARWFSAGAGNQFDSAFSTSVSGYPLGSTVLATDGSGYWISTTNANTINPENTTAALTGWLPYSQTGVTSITGLAATSVTLTTLQAGKGRITLAGVLTANINLIFPAWSKGWVVVNNCTGAFSVTCKTISGAGVSILTGLTAVINGDGTNITLDSNVMNITNQVTGVVGTTRNAAMSIATASATATFTADEVIVGAALGGAQYRIGSFSKTINLATTGAGGMDTGTVPTSGFVSIYAIYNPTTGASALLAVNSTSAVSPEVYGGTNMPSGYSSSALVSTWQITSSQFSIGVQKDRHVATPSNQVFSATSSIPTTPTALSLSSYIPPNAKIVDLFQRFVSTSADLQQMAITSTSGSIGLFGSIFNAAAVGQQYGSTGSFNLSVAQSLYYYQTGSVSTTRQLYTTGYTF